MNERSYTLRTNEMRSIPSSMAKRLAAYGALIKCRQTSLLLATGLAGYMSGRPTDLSPGTLFWMLFSLFGAIGGTTALNMVIDRDIDAKMERTAWRPLPAGTLSPAAALIFGGILTAIGLGTAFWMDKLFGLVVTTGSILDLVVYTLWLKRRTALAIIFGGVSGGMPVLAGRALAVGHLDLTGGLLTLAVLLWIPSHIVTFTIRYAKDYRRAAIPTWPERYGVTSARRFIAFANGLCGIALVIVGILLHLPHGILATLLLLGLTALAYSLWATKHPSQETDFRMFKLASAYMLISMSLLAWGALM